MKFNYSKRIFVLSLGVFLIVLVLNIVFSNLLLEKILNINNKIKQQNISSQERERNLALKDSVIGTRELRLELEKYFIAPGDPQTASFVNYLEGQTKKTGLSPNIKSIDYENIETLGGDSNVLSVRLRLGAVGKWSDVYSLLIALESLPRVSFLNSVSLERQSEGWSVDIDMSVAKLKN